MGLSSGHGVITGVLTALAGGMFGLITGEYVPIWAGF
jgi:hypothetical protein